MAEEEPDYDVLVVGAGNAGLTAAIAAREGGATVLLLEAAERADRGGNSRYASGVFRVAHDGLGSIQGLVEDDGRIPWSRIEIEPYPEERYLADLERSTGGALDRGLTELVVRRSTDTVEWMRGHGVRWSLSMTKFASTDELDADEVIRMSPGGELIAEGNGVALTDSLFAACERLGVDIRYESPVVELLRSGRSVDGVVVRGEDRDETIRARAVVLAAGGFEASAEARLRYLGPGWDLVKVRGSRYDTGQVLALAIEHGARSVGHWSGAHAVPIDADAPDIGDLDIGDSTARYSYPYGIMVNLDGDRFLDEGRDEMVFTYAEIGRALLAQPKVTAFQVFDERSARLLEPRYATATPAVAGTLPELAAEIGIEPGALEATVAAFNAACEPGDFDAFRKDGLRAEPVGQPPKSNWARPIDSPPYSAYRVTCGITFTFGGIAVDDRARVLGVDGRPLPGLFATGEITGGFFAHNIPSGAGLTRGAVFGRIAGESAVETVRSR